MPGRKVFEDSVVPLPPDDGLAPNGLLLHGIGTRHDDEPMDLLFSLELPTDVSAELEARVARGEVVPAKELAAMTAPQDVRDRLVNWLAGHGFTVDHVSADGTSVYATSTVTNVAEQLQVDMARVTRDGITYNAARTPPSLPDDVGEGVRAIIGLQPFRQANKHLRRVPAVAVPAIDNRPPYLVSEVLAAYGADGLEVTGAGQTIAILIDTVPATADLKAFWERNGLPVKPSQVRRINVAGGTLPPIEGEETLDVEWSSGIAPGAKIRVYASGSLRFTALDRALDRIIADLPRYPGMRQLSISLGLGETFMGGPNGEVAVQHQKFLRLAAAGVNVFVSSGDAGSNPDQTGHGSSGPLQAEYESSDPAVIGVGGTTLHLRADGSIDAETAWIGSGGGSSIFFARPAWQTGPGVPDGDKRLVPDVASAADPNTGALVVLHGQDVQIGGTSWSAPVWAGICALINEALQRAGKPALGFANPVLYPLAGTKAFRDIVIGTNGAFTASAGYDRVTGIGVPDVGALIKALTG
ncbi:MAG: S53 family peptidase [Kineosporiaceae bacterium]